MTRFAAALSLALLLGSTMAVSVVAPARAASGTDISWTRPTESGIVHRPPEVARVGDTVTVAIPGSGPAGTCSFTIEAVIGSHFREMSVTESFATPGPTDSCPAWTFVMPRTPSGTYQVHASGGGGTLPIVDLAVTQGVHRTFASSPYPVTSWDPADAFATTPTFGTPMVISPPAGIDSTCRFWFNGSGGQYFGSPDTDRSCAPWHVTIPELRPYPFMENGFEYVWEATYLFDGQSTVDADGHSFSTRSQVPLDVGQGGGDPATSDRPFVVWESSANPGYWTTGQVTATPTLVGIDAGTCVYSLYRYPGDTTWVDAGSVPVVDGACAPLVFDVASLGHIQYSVNVRDANDVGISTASGGANIVEPMQVPSISASNSVVAGAPLPVTATIGTGAPVGFTVTGTKTSTTTALGTDGLEPNAVMTTCGSGTLDPTAGTNTAKATCRLPTAGSYSVRVTIRDASGNKVSRARTVRVVADTYAPKANIPVVRPFTGRQIGTTVPIGVGVSGSDLGTGIARYVVARSVDGGSWTTLSSSVTGSALATTVAPGHAYRFRVQAVDRAGNHSAWVYGPTVTPAMAQETSGSYAGTWSSVADATASGGHLRRSSTVGAQASFSFRGRGVALAGPIGPGGGRARVYVDGAYLQTIDLSALSTSPRRIVFSRIWSSPGTHRLTIRVAGGGPVSIDLFVVLR